MEYSPLGTLDPLKTRLHRELKERIANGHYPSGIQLPSEAEMVEQYGVSRSTVRSALSALEAEGLIVRRWGVGTFVCERQRIANPITEAMDFRELIAGQRLYAGRSGRPGQPDRGRRRQCRGPRSPGGQRSSES